MAQDIVLRKRSRDPNRVCTIWNVPEPTYKFTLDTCDDGIRATIRLGNSTRAVLTIDAPRTLIYDPGRYEICIDGEGTGVVYAEWTSQSVIAEDCCDELRNVDINLQRQIDVLRNRITNLEIQIGNLGENCCDELRQEITSLKERVTILENRLNNLNITGGTGITVNKQGDTYTIINTGSGGTGEDCCDELRQEINNIKNRLTTIEGDITNITNRLDGMTITGGTGISVVKNGDNYVITNTLPGGGGGSLPSDFDIKAGENVQVARNGNEFTVSATDTITTLSEGANVTITKSGNNYTIAASGGSGGGGLPTDFEIAAGDNVQVAKAGNKYTISSTDTNTVTTLVPGTGVGITDAGTGGDHVYTITAASGEDVDVQSTSPNLTVTVETT